jgi:general secretion pathway protein D
MSLNQNRIDIADLIKRVGEANERTILFDDSVRGVVSIVAKRPVTLDEAWMMLDASLAIRGFSLLPSTGEIWRIAKVADATGESPFVEDVSDSRDSYVTSLIPLRVADTRTVMKVLEPLAGASVTLVPFEPTNSLIASGPERRIARLTTLADALDRVDERPIGFRVLRYRDVTEIESWLEAFFESGALSESDIEIWSDERTNSLIYRASEKEADRLRGFADRFDRPIEAEGQIRVLRVLNRDADEVAELIRALRDTGSTSRSLPGAPEVFTSLSKSDYTITVDSATRSLIVRADTDTHIAIREVVELLDEAPQLIAVDIKVTEIRAPRAFSLGFAFSIPLSSGDDSSEVVARLVSTPAGTGLAASPGADTTLFGRVDQDLNVPFTLDDGTGVAIPIANTGVIQAGDVKVRTEVLIEPSLIVTVGDTHEIFVGNNFPVPVNSASLASDDGGTGTASNPLRRETTIERRDTGIKMVLDATASRAGPIQLDLEVELSQLAPSAAGDIQVVGPTFIEQKFLVNARLNDGEAAIVAMNKDHRAVKGEGGTPFLSDIPLLGWFFSSKRSRAQDVHLILAAQARRIATPAEFAADTVRRRLAFERRNAREDSLPGVADGESGFAVLVTTRGRRDDADAIAESLDMRGYKTEIHRWELRDRELFDVYVTSLDSMADAANVASTLNGEGWQTNLTLLPTRS